MSLGTEDAEATLKLAEAINRLAAALERVTFQSGFAPAIQVNHSGIPANSPPLGGYTNPPYYQR